MSVLDNLAQGEPLRLIRELESVQAEIKAPQSVGSASVMLTLVESSNAVDLTVPAGVDTDILIEFTPADVSFGGGLVYAAYSSRDGGATYNGILLSIRQRVGADNIQRWKSRVFNSSSGTPINYKFRFLCIGTGTISASLVS